MIGHPATFTLEYANSSFPDLITGISSSYGASASFGEGYVTSSDDGPVLTNITDTAGISSAFQYVYILYPNFAFNYQICTMITPYGTTGFSPCVGSTTAFFDRYVEITNAVGQVELYGMINMYSGSDWPDRGKICLSLYDVLCPGI